MVTGGFLVERFDTLLQAGEINKKAVIRSESHTDFIVVLQEIYRLPFVISLLS